MRNFLHGVTWYTEFGKLQSKNIDKIDTKNCRNWAMNNFSLEAVAPMYEEFFQSVLNIYGKQGWYEPNPERIDLDYKLKKYPGYHTT